MLHPEDQGTGFGIWPNQTANLMYRDVMPLALSGIDANGRVADYGGANGILKRWIPQAITVDYDVSKRPDVCADILTHVGTYDLIVMRYVLHYLTNAQIRALLGHLATFHKGRVLIIQFVNEDLAAKLRNSVGERKFFRTELQLQMLLTAAPWYIVSRKAVEYRVDADFYKWRLAHPDPSAHDEKILIYELACRA